LAAGATALGGPAAGIAAFKGAKAVAGTAGTVLHPLTTVAAILTIVVAVYLPLVPMLAILFYSLFWILEVVILAVFAPLWALAVGIPQGDGFIGQHGKEGLSWVTDIALRPLLLVGMFVISLGLYFLASALLVPMTSQVLSGIASNPSPGLWISAAELIAGLFLMLGLFTRASALVSVGFSVVLMLMFGWQGATCIDEWTMAAANLAMGGTLLLAGGGAYALDNLRLGRNPALADRPWFRWSAGSLPLPLDEQRFRTLALVVLAFVAAFDISTYSYYRGSVITPFHGGPVSPTKHHVTLTNGALAADGSVRFHAYLDAGTPEAPSHIVDAALLAAGSGEVIAHWDTKTLTSLPKTAIVNDFAYQQFKPGPFGIVAGVGAMATITLPPAPGAAPLTAPGYVLRLTSANNHVFTLALPAAH
jgi:uncharacterized membrane protein YphA (DoxX/SURF4 family)